MPFRYLLLEYDAFKNEKTDDNIFNDRLITFANPCFVSFLIR
jgi:hypothetical protein